MLTPLFSQPLCRTKTGAAFRGAVLFLRVHASCQRSQKNQRKKGLHYPCRLFLDELVALTENRLNARAAINKRGQFLPDAADVHVNTAVVTRKLAP